MRSAPFLDYQRHDTVQLSPFSSAITTGQRSITNNFGRTSDRVHDPPIAVVSLELSGVRVHWDSSWVSLGGLIDGQQRLTTLTLLLSLLCVTYRYYRVDGSGLAR